MSFLLLIIFLLILSTTIYATTIFWITALTFLILFFIIFLRTRHILSTNIQRRGELLDKLGVPSDKQQEKKVVGFFHPYCNAGGGGERVLWTAIRAIQDSEEGKGIVCVVYTGDVEAGKQEIIEKVQARFAIALSHSSLDFVFLRKRWLVEDDTWPRFTLLGQSLGSMFLVWEAMSSLVPDLFIDTMGYAFTYPIVRLLTTPRLSSQSVLSTSSTSPNLLSQNHMFKPAIIAYIHYPTISTTMITRVASRQAGHTNDSIVAKSQVLTWGKGIYYTALITLYSRALHIASVRMVNSSWTKNHVDAILGWRNEQGGTFAHWVAWFLAPLLDFIFGKMVSKNRNLKEVSKKADEDFGESTQIVYPPCDTREISGFSLEGRKKVILTVGQFRPEKDHPAQIRAFHELLKKHPEYRDASVPPAHSASDPQGGEILTPEASKPLSSQSQTDVHIEQSSGLRLVLLGGARNAEDAARVEDLQKLARELGVDSQTQFVINAPYPEMLRWLSKASVGLHTMVDEHFGISVVEFMAAGMIPVTHASGGPLNDIVVPVAGEPTGYHATTPVTFADALHTALTLTTEADRAMRERGRKWAISKFSEAEFEKGWEETRWRNYL